MNEMEEGERRDTGGHEKKGEEVSPNTYYDALHCTSEQMREMREEFDRKESDAHDWNLRDRLQHESQYGIYGASSPLLSPPLSSTTFELVRKTGKQ